MTFCFKFCSVHSIGYNFHSTFHLRFRLEVKSFFPIQFSVGSKQRATTTLDFEHVFFVALSFLVVRSHSLTLFALEFFVCATFSSVRPTLAYSGFHFLFFVGRVPNKPLDFANLF